MDFIPVVYFKSLRSIMKKNIIILSCMLVSCLVGFSQTQPMSIEELRIKLNDDGSRFLKMTFMNQTWLRFNQSNPGTTVLNEKADQTLDIGLRRTRIQFFGQLTDHVFFYTQFGQNNFNF